MTGNDGMVKHTNGLDCTGVGSKLDFLSLSWRIAFYDWPLLTSSSSSSSLILYLFETVYSTK